MYEETNKAKPQQMERKNPENTPNTQNSNVKPQQGKSEFERLSNHVQTLLREKKAHLKKISAMDEKIKNLEEELASKEDVTQPEEVAGILSAAHGNAEKYVEEIRALANDEMLKANETAKKLIEGANFEAQVIKNNAREEALTIQKRAKLTLQQATNERIAIDTKINEATAKADSIYSQANREAEIILIRSKEEAAGILDEANLKLGLAENKYQKSAARITTQTNQILRCAKTEYEDLRSLIEKSTQQYTELCKNLANFDNLVSFAETSEEAEITTTVPDAIETKEDERP